MEAGAGREGEVLAISAEGGVDLVEGAAVATTEDAVDAVITNFPVVKAVAPVSGTGPDLVGSGVPVVREVAGGRSGGPRIEADVVDGLEVCGGGWSGTEADA